MLCYMTSTQDTISSVVRLLMTLRGESQETIARDLGLPRGSISNRLAGRTRWTSDDLSRLAAHFGVLPAVLVTPPADLLGPDLTREVGDTLGFDAGHRGTWVRVTSTRPAVAYA